MKDLIERLEKATEPSHLLDAEIGQIEGYNSFHSFVGTGWERDGAIADLPRYTSSLDAALTLAPKDSAIGLVMYLSDNPDDKQGRYRATIMPPISIKNVSDRTVYAATLPLAVCIAALGSRLPEGDK